MAKSIMHRKEDRTCYLCMLLRDDYNAREDLQEHHAMPGTANRRLSERYGLKVYLCIGRAGCGAQQHKAPEAPAGERADGFRTEAFP